MALFCLKTGVWHLEKAKVEGQKRDQWLPGPGGKGKGDYKKTGIFSYDETSIHCSSYTTECVCQNSKNCTLKGVDVNRMDTVP